VLDKDLAIIQAALLMILPLEKPKGSGKKKCDFSRRKSPEQYMF
jgi:hypothetical protein